MAEDFNRIFAESGDKTAISNSDYDGGWSFIGDNPPEVEDFNSVMNEQDRKLKELKRITGNNFIVFDVKGTTVWNVTDDIKSGLIKPLVYCVGGGGSGVRDSLKAGAGGGSGGMAMRQLDLTGETSVLITVAAGGIPAASDVDGGNGGSSSFGAFISASGGAGGRISPVSGGGGVGGVGIGGSVNANGSGGGSACQGVASTTYVAGAGGASFLAGGAVSRAANNNKQGVDGNSGGGGSGGILNGSAGAGGDGLVFLIW